jgi:hypothetical protein
MPSNSVAPLAFYFSGDLPGDYTDLELIGTISTMDSFQKIYRPEIYNANSAAGKSSGVFQQQHAEVIISHVRGKIIPCNALDTFVGSSVKNIGFQYFNQREGIPTALTINIHLHGNDVEFDGITITLRIIPMRQGIETIVNHPEGVA